jgi:adenosylhomocysteine nucleosidase
MNQCPVLVCFAVKEEARFFRARPGVCKVLITGMGRENAAAGITKALSAIRPRLVIAAGFAGGLNPEIATGTVLCDADQNAGLDEKLLKSGAVPAKFHCADCVAVLAAEKQVLWQLTGADAVEMESSAIRKMCAEHKIPSATIRVISDAAGEDLPLDFNALMTRRRRINCVKLAWTLMCGPGKIPQLLRFEKQTVFAAQRLGEVLQKILRDGF